jgi:hypothetical protein
MVRNYKKIIEDIFYNSVNRDLTAQLLTEFIEYLKTELNKSQKKYYKKLLNKRLLK